MTALAIHPQDPTSVYAGAFTENDEGDPSNPRIFKSNDAGKSWSSTSDSGLPIACVVGGLVTDPQNPGTVYAYTGCDGVFRSNDKAETWQPVNFGLPERGAGRFVGALAIDPQNSILYVVAFRCDQSGKLPPPACDSRVFRSLNRGDAWSEATSAALTGSMFQSMVIDPGTPNTLYAKVLVPNMQNEVLKSNDGEKAGARQTCSWERGAVSVSSRLTRRARFMQPVWRDYLRARTRARVGACSLFSKGRLVFLV